MNKSVTDFGIFCRTSALFAKDFGPAGEDFGPGKEGLRQEKWQQSGAWDDVCACGYSRWEWTCVGC